MSGSKVRTGIMWSMTFSGVSGRLKPMRNRVEIASLSSFWGTDNFGVWIWWDKGWAFVAQQNRETERMV